ncbi:Plasma membrane proteolipid 3 [Fusarium oxysporum f. sp. conglutinans]|nr:Plasma membrane proteolipid 3 [Fusarium oxysporum f. sp. conglutinans]
MPFTTSRPVAKRGSSSDKTSYVYSHNSDICKVLLAIILPPVGVFLERGCGTDLLINILLTILGFIPGIIHALYIILKY